MTNVYCNADSNGRIHPNTSGCVHVSNVTDYLYVTCTLVLVEASAASSLQRKIQSILIKPNENDVDYNSEIFGKYI